jgi:hypothetical protein
MTANAGTHASYDPLDRLPFGGQALLNASLSRSFWA